MKNQNRRKTQISRAEVVKSVKFMNLILQISKSKNTKKIYNEYIKKMIMLFKYFYNYIYCLDLMSLYFCFFLLMIIIFFTKR